jgi:hypothetical protein
VEVQRNRYLHARAVAVIGTDRGIERVSFTVYGKAGHYTMLFADHALYLRGDALGLALFTIVGAQGKKHVGRWISIDRSVTYAKATDLTLGSFLADRIPHHDLRIVKAAGRGRTALRGTANRPGSSRADRALKQWVYVHSTAQPLPLEVRMQGLTTHFKDRTVLGPWNAPVNVHAPAHAVPISRLLAHP